MISFAVANTMNGTSKKEKAENLLCTHISSFGANDGAATKGKIGSATVAQGQDIEQDDADALAKVAIGQLQNSLSRTRKRGKGNMCG